MKMIYWFLFISLLSLPGFPPASSAQLSVVSFSITSSVSNEFTENFFGKFLKAQQSFCLPCWWNWLLCLPAAPKRMFKNWENIRKPRPTRIHTANRAFLECPCCVEGLQILVVKRLVQHCVTAATHDIVDGWYHKIRYWIFNQGWDLEIRQTVVYVEAVDSSGLRQVSLLQPSSCRAVGMQLVILSVVHHHVSIRYTTSVQRVQELLMQAIKYALSNMLW